jgi:hypothetical protein
MLLAVAIALAAYSLSSAGGITTFHRSKTHRSNHVSHPRENAAVAKYRAHEPPVVQDNEGVPPQAPAKLKAKSASTSPKSKPVTATNEKTASTTSTTRSR